MMDVTTILLAISVILFFGFFAEFIFRKLNVPDVLLLIAFGIIVGPNVLKYVSASDLAGIAPAFTTFALLFLLFDGAFNINLASLIREFSESFLLTIFGFLVSSAIVFVVMLGGFYFLNGSITGSIVLVSIFTGFLLGGVSSSFVIPILEQMKISKNLYSLLALEGALTDVFCIVFSLAIIEIMNVGVFGLQESLIHLTSLFAVAALIGLIGGIVWIILVLRVFKEHNYIMVVAYLLLIYVSAEFLKGNGAIAALFFGLMLNNSKQLSSIIRGILSRKARLKKEALKGELGVSVTTPSEKFFYHQVSFLLKTFFFVYIGILLDISDWKALVIGIALSFLLMGSRMSSMLLTKKMEPESRSLINSMFARGLAAAAVAQLALQAGLPSADFVVKVAYVVITGTIILSSVRIFLVKRKLPAAEGAR